MFGQGASSEESAYALVRGELSLFRRLVIPPSESLDPLAWWRVHENHFPNVGHLAKQILGIPGSQIETERVFSIAGVLTALRRCRLQVENLDRLVMVVKNWPNDPRLDCKATASMKEFMAVETSLTEENYDFIEVAGYFEDFKEEEQQSGCFD